MIYRFRHWIIGPLAIFWLILTVSSVVTGGLAWSRFSRRVDASADPEQFRESINQLQQITWVAGLLGIGAGLFALYFIAWITTRNEGGGNCLKKSCTPNKRSGRKALSSPT